METLRQDISYGFRLLKKKPGFAAIVVLVLALGIGANTAIFSVVNAVLLSPLPFPAPDRLVTVIETNLPRGIEDIGCAPPDYREWRDRNRLFDQMAALNTNYFNISGMEEPEKVMGGTATANLFAMLRVNPLLGRTFLPDDEIY